MFLLALLSFLFYIRLTTSEIIKAIIIRMSKKTLATANSKKILIKAISNPFLSLHPVESLEK